MRVASLESVLTGGHAGIGHRSRAVGNQDFLRRVNRQEACVEQETSGQKEVRDNGVTSAAAEAFCSSCSFLLLKSLPIFVLSTHRNLARKAGRSLRSIG